MSYWGLIDCANAAVFYNGSLCVEVVFDPNKVGKPIHSASRVKAILEDEWIIIFAS